MKPLLTLLLVSGLWSLPSGAAERRPNIIVFMADDMGYADAGFTGAKDIKTPHLDALAASGVTFKQGYANHPFCGPSRAALLSGRYQHRFGFETNPAYDPSNTVMGIDAGEILFPKRLQKVGYTTGCIGKWHLGAATPFHPMMRGFNYFYGFLGGGHDYFEINLISPVKEGYKQALERNGKPAGFDGYLTTALSRDAAAFVETNSRAERDSRPEAARRAGAGAPGNNKPFFLYVAYNAPHMPLQAPREDIERYAHIPDKKRRVYAAMVDVMDRGIGEVIQSLEKNDLRDNTLVFFLSDNGGPQSSEKNPTKGNGSSNAPFRGGKGNLYDGGVHVPFIASWPAKIPAGSTFDPPVIAIDIARTAVEVAGANAATAPAMEGVDLIPFVLGEKQGAPHDALFWRGGDGQAWSILASNGDKHLMDSKSRGPELFHLPDDVSESNDLLSEKPERAKELHAMWSEWDKQNVPCRMTGYTNYHKERDKFYFDVIPEKARKAGYQPKIKGQFK